MDKKVKIPEIIAILLSFIYTDMALFAIFGACATKPSTVTLKVLHRLLETSKTLAFHHKQYMCYHMPNSYLKRSLDYKKGKFSSSLNCNVLKYYAAKTQSVQSLDY